MGKNTNTITNRKRSHWILNAIAASLVLVFVAVGCQNKKNKSNPPPPPPPVGNPYGVGGYGNALCPTCNVNVAWTIFAGTDSQSASGAVSLSLDFYGDPNLGYYFSDPRIPIMYTGPTVVRGQMTINQIDPLICSIPVGQYQILSLSPGQWQGGVVSSGSSYGGGYAYGGGYGGSYGPTSLYMQAQNLQYGNIVIMRLAKGIIYNPNGTYSTQANKLGGTLVFESRDGMPCYSYSGTTYTELY